MSVALQSAASVVLPSGTHIQHITAPVFLATKLEAFAGRGNNDHLFSHDLGDLLAVIDGRDILLDECRVSDAELRDYLAAWMTRLLSTSAFMEALPGHLPGGFGQPGTLA